MSTSKKGNDLEDKFFDFLLSQQRRGDFVFGAYPPELCKIFKKKKYYCKEREADVEFDVVIELYRKGSSSYHLVIAFECKNHDGSVSEIHVNDFSSKLSRIFKHAAKGVMVVSSRLQSGAANIAKNSKIGIVKFDENGVDVVAERKAGSYVEPGFVKAQIFDSNFHTKSLKFSALYDGVYCGSVDELLIGLVRKKLHDGKIIDNKADAAIPFVADEEIKKSAQTVLEKIEYEAGPVDLKKVCSTLSFELQLNDQTVQNDSGEPILGSANFSAKSIQINRHDNKQRERFTIAHEIGHFCLQHDRYLHSETVVEKDLLVTSEKKLSFNYVRLESQANAFASHLILPDELFKRKVDEFRANLDIRDRGHGYIFVDDQPCNFGPYGSFLSDLSTYFDVSKQAIEIKLKKMKLLTDQRKKLDGLAISHLVGSSFFYS